MTNDNLRSHGVNDGFWFKIVVPAILRRDNHKCVGCSSNRYLHVHHICYEHQVYNNFITLCKSCHTKVHRGTLVVGKCFCGNAEGSKLLSCAKLKENS